LKDDAFALLILITLDDLVPGNFLAVLFSDTLVVHRTQIALTQQAKLELFPTRGGIESDRNINETEADAAFPDCARHTNLIRYSGRNRAPNCCHPERGRDISVLNATPAPKR